MKPKQTTTPKVINQPIRLLATLLILVSTLQAYAQESNQELHKIATIDEASGISFCHQSATLIVANDEGSFYEITPQGKILSRHKLGEFDLEGVVCEEQTLTFAIEGGALLEVNRHSQQSHLLPLVGYHEKISKRSGIEGITKIGEHYYLSIQAKKPEDSRILIVKKGKQKAQVIESFSPKIIDTAGMDYHQNQLYIVSDTQDRLYLYDSQNKRILQTIPLPPFAQEGVALDDQGNIYFADDNGAVLKYQRQELNMLAPAPIKETAVQP
jgi:uncharacterized protein YjiK